MAEVFADGLTLDQLRVLLAVADEGSFSAAARHLHRAQGAVSYNIATLEGLLGYPLFDRSARLPRLTPAGESLVSQARGVIARVDELRVVARALSEGLEPRLVVTVDVLFPVAALGPIVHELRERFPTVELDLRSGILTTVVDAVCSGACDLGVTGLQQLPEGVESRLSLEVELVPVVAPSHPLARDRRAPLGEHVQIVLSDPLDTSEGARFGVEARKIWRVGDLQMRASLIREGVGWGRLPRHTIVEELRAGTLIELGSRRGKAKTGRVQFAVIHSTRHPLGPAGRWLVDVLCTAKIRPEQPDRGL